MKLIKRMFQREPVEHYLTSDQKFNKTLDAKALLSLGIGSVIGTGIFILPGTVAATTAGPGVVFSFILAAMVSGLVAMAYSEMASALPVAGSAYSYGNVVFGEVVGWIVGWALILEYILAVAAVATGWSAYLAGLIAPLWQMPTALSGAFNPSAGTYGNVVAAVIVLIIGWILRGGMKESIRWQNAMVVLKVVIILLFIIVGAFYINPANYHPMIPARVDGAFGVQGVLTGTAMVFFAFLGFDVLSSSAVEAKNPKRDMPIGIIGTLIVAAVLYGLVALVLTGMVHYPKLNVADPVAYALQAVGQNGWAFLITVGALVGMYTMMYTMLYASSRLIYAMGRDGLIPGGMGRLTTQGNPTRALTVATIFVALLAAFVPLEHLVDLVNMGTLIAFIVVSLGIIPLRKREDIDHQGYQMPGYPVLPLLAAGFSFFLMTQLRIETLLTALAWFVLGLMIYLMYGMKHSRLNQFK